MRRFLVLILFAISKIYAQTSDYDNSKLYVNHITDDYDYDYNNCNKKHIISNIDFDLYKINYYKNLDEKMVKLQEVVEDYIKMRNEYNIEKSNLEFFIDEY
jgi:hypothetical protein